MELQEYEVKTALINHVSNTLEGHRKTSFDLMKREDQLEIAVIMLAKGQIGFSVIKGSSSPSPEPYCPQESLSYPWTTPTKRAKR